MVKQPDQVAFIVADLELYTRKEIVRLATNLDANLRDAPPGGTPVDTGWARANWLPSITAPKIIDGRAPEAVRKAGGPDGDPAFLGQANAQIASRADMATEGMNAVLNWKPADGPIFVTNNVPYIGALNAGHSPQSPPGFVQAAMEKAVKETYSSGASKAQRNRRASAARAKKARPK